MTDFFNNANSITNFINNLAALLQIQDTSRIKVVGVHQGSTIVTTAVTPSSNPTDPTVQTVGTTATSAINSGSLSSSLSGIGLGNVIGSSSVYYPLTDSTPE